MKSVRLVQFFPAKEENRVHSQIYVEDLQALSGQKDVPRWQC